MTEKEKISYAYFAEMDARDKFLTGCKVLAVIVIIVGLASEIISYY